jgi:hypothetical protein
LVLKRRIAMKKLIPFLTVTAILLSGTAAAQSNSPTPPVPSKTVTIFGVVSDSGKTIVAKNARTWSITNPGMLAGREGHRVRLKCRVYPDNKNILVLSVRLTDTHTQYAANPSDSAFRR